MNYLIYLKFIFLFTMRLYIFFIIIPELLFTLIYIYDFFLNNYIYLLLLLIVIEEKVL